MEFIHKITAWAHGHKYMAIGGVLGVLVLLYIVLHSGSKGPALTSGQALAQAKLSSQTAIELAQIQAKAAQAPYMSAVSVAQIQASAADKQASAAVDVQKSGIAASLQQALAAIGLQSHATDVNALSAYMIQKDNNATGLAATQYQSNSQLAIATNAMTMQEWLANLAKTGTNAWEGFFPGGVAGQAGNYWQWTGGSTNPQLTNPSH